MKNYNKIISHDMDLCFEFIKDRMKELNIPQYKLAEMIGMAECTLIRNFKKETEMSFRNYIKICEALKLINYIKKTS